MQFHQLLQLSWAAGIQSKLCRYVLRSSRGVRELVVADRKINGCIGCTDGIVRRQLEFFVLDRSRWLLDADVVGPGEPTVHGAMGNA